jgi:beta-1,4-mannosyltransferase
MEPIEVIFLPYESWRNPYQTALAQALTSHGVRVQPAEASTLRQAITASRLGELDIVHFHWVSAFTLSGTRLASMLKTSLFLTACRALKQHGVKIVWTIHNLYEHEHRDPDWEQRTNQIFFQLCNQVIVHCPRAIELVQRAYELPKHAGDRFGVIPHGHYQDQYPNKISRKVARSKMGIDPDDFVFLFFGQIRPYKNINELINAFDSLETQQAQLLIAGEPAHDSLKSKIHSVAGDHSRIHTWLERVPDETIQNYMNAADVVVLPFRNILSSSTITLAMSFSKAVITPALGCSPDILAEQPELLYDPQDAEGLQKAMRRSLSIDLVALGKNNLKNISPFSWEIAAQFTAMTYKDCLRSNQANS